MIIYIKNMVCDRCILVVSQELCKINLNPRNIALGEVDFGDMSLAPRQIHQIASVLEPLGFELIDDKAGRTIEKIKSSIIESVHHQESDGKVKLSDLLKDSVHYDYCYLSHLFSTVEGITIEQYLINQRIEKAKELIVYNELNLTEIAYQLGYSSLAHLSGQFNKVTGMSPSHFRRLKNDKQRQSIDKV